MTAISRRIFLAMAGAVPASVLLDRAARSSRVVELRHASVFHAPYYADRLVPGCRLSSEQRADATYLTLDGHIMGSLPDEQPAVNPRVWTTTRDSNGRLRIFVRLTTERVESSRRA